MKTAALIGAAVLLLAGSASADQTTNKAACDHYLKTGAQPQGAKCDLSKEPRSGLDIGRSGPVYVFRVREDGTPRFLEDRTATAKPDDNDQSDNKPN